MSSESEVLKKIWEHNQKRFLNRGTYIRLVANQTGLGTDYTRYLCQCLLKKEQIKQIKGKRDCYKITFKGKKGLNGGQNMKLENDLFAVRQRLSLGQDIKKAGSFFRRFFKDIKRC